jgi:hypothetical protein
MANKPRLINFPKIPDARGNLSFIENEKNVPFKIARVFWIYDVPGGELRGGHAYRTQQEMIVALSGSFDVILHDGKEETKISLNRSYFGLYVPALTWRHLENFSTNSLAMVITDQAYSESEYIRDFNLFTQSAGQL